MQSKVNYNLVIDGRWLNLMNRGISTFLINLIEVHNDKLFNGNLIFINKTSVDIVKKYNIKYKIISKYLIISDLQIFLYLMVYNVKTFLSPGNILPIFPLFCKNKTLILHDVSFNYNKNKIGKRTFKQFLGACLKKILVPISLWRSTRIITVSNFAKNEILKYYKSLRNKEINVIYHGFKLNDKNLPKKEKYTFLAILGESEQKNIRNFLKGCENAVFNRNFNVCLVGVTEDYLLKNDIGFNFDWLTVTGKIENKLVASKIMLSSCLVMPSYYESFGMPVIEALIHKKPVICSNTGALPEITKNMFLYFNPNDVIDISEKLKIFIDNKAQLIEYTKKWHFNYSNLFSFNTFRENYRNILNSYQN